MHRCGAPFPLLVFIVVVALGGCSAPPHQHAPAARLYRLPFAKYAAQAGCQHH